MSDFLIGEEGMKQLKIYFICIFVTLISISLAYEAQATNAMKLIGIGPVQRSMGGASVGLPLDSATTITNPAGVSRVAKRVDFGVSYFSPNPKYSATGGQIATQNKVIKTNGTSFVIPAFGMIMPWNDKWSYGFGAYGVGGMGVDYASNLYSNVTYTEYSFLKFAPSVAYSFNDRLTFGVAPNFNWAAMNFNTGETTAPPHNGGSAYGIGFTLGLLYDISDVLAIGLAYESQQWFQDFEFNTTSGRDALDFDQPQSVALGFGYKPFESTRVALDFVWIDWSRTNGNKKPPYSENASGSDPFDMGWSDQIVYKIGIEQDLTEKVVVRAGYNYGKNPTNNDRAFEVIAFPAIMEHHITAGLGFALTEDLAINIGGMYAPESVVKGSNVGQGITNFTTKMTQFSADFALAYMFD